jgi:hypothetical protein
MALLELSKSSQRISTWKAAHGQRQKGDTSPTEDSRITWQLIIATSFVTGDVMDELTFLAGST